MTPDERTEQIRAKAKLYIRALWLSRDVRKLHLQKTTVAEFIAHVNDSIGPSTSGKELVAETEFETFRNFVVNPDAETNDILAAIARLSSADFGLAAAASRGPIPPSPPPPNGPPGADVIIKRIRADIDRLRENLDELESLIEGIEPQP